MAKRRAQRPTVYPPLIVDAVWIGGRKYAWLCLGRQLSSSDGTWRTVVLLLDAQGRQAAVSEAELGPRAEVVGGIASSGRGRAIFGLPRYLERDDSVLSTEVAGVDWYSARWKGGEVSVSQLDGWDDVNLGLQLYGAAVDETTSLWVSSYFPPPMGRVSNLGEGRLLVGRRRGNSFDRLVKTDQLATAVSRPVIVGDEIFFVTTPGYERVELWSWDGEGQPKRLTEIAKRRNKKQLLAPPCVAWSGDRLCVSWVCYADRVGAKKPRTWQGLLFGCEVSLDPFVCGKPFVASSDERVVATTLQLHSRSDDAIATWESRPKRGGGGMRLQPVCEREEVVRPTTLEPSSVALFATMESDRLLTAVCSRGVPDWTLEESIGALVNRSRS